MERLIDILARAGDVVVEFARDRTPEAVHCSQHCVTVRDAIDEDAEREQVVDFVERLSLLGVLPHLLVNAVDVLGAALDCRLDVLLRQLLLQDLLDAGHVSFARGAAGGDQLGDLVVGFGLQVLEGEVLQFPLDLPDAQAAGERRKDIHGLLRRLDLLGRLDVLQGAHVVEAVGELDDDDAHVLSHGDEHLAQVLGLHRAVERSRVRRVLGDALQLGGAVDELGDIDAEAALEFLVRDAAVFLDIVQERRRDGDGIELKVGDGEGSIERMDDVGVAGFAELVTMALRRELVGLFY